MEPLGNYGIHIIVRAGNVTLFGTVSNEADKTKAGLEARDVLGVHNVDNEIQIVGE
jgi:osmotically-inducible protein OsmY